MFQVGGGASLSTARCWLFRIIGNSTNERRDCRFDRESTDATGSRNGGGLKGQLSNLPFRSLTSLLFIAQLENRVSPFDSNL